MPISVTTGGPEGGATDLTFGDMIDAIADDIDDSNSEYEDAIERAILAAIRYCERDIFYFNETRDVTFTTVDAQQWYDDSDASEIPYLVRIVAAWSENSDGQRTPLQRVTPEELETLSDDSGSTGEPYCYTYFDQQIRLYPIPGSTTYTIRLQLGPYRLATPVASTDTNAWFTEAYDMIKARAKYVLYKDTLKAPDMAAEALNDYNDQFRVLKAETSRRHGTGFIQVTCF